MTPAYFALAQAAIARGDTTTARQHLQAYRRHVAPEEGDSDDQGAALASLRGALQLAYGTPTQQAEVVRQFADGAYASGGRFIGGALQRDPTAEALRAQEQIGDVFVEQNGLYTFRTIAWLRAGRYDTVRRFVRDTSLVSASARLSRLEAATRLVSREAMEPTDVPPNLAAPLCEAQTPLLYRLMGCYRQARLTMMQARDSSTMGGSDSATQHAAPGRNAQRLLQDVISVLTQAGNVDLANVARGYVTSLDGLAALRAGQPDAHSVLDSAHVLLVPFEIFGGEWEPMEVQVQSLIGGGEPARALPYAQIIATTDPYGHYLAGRAHEALGNLEAARTAYEQFVAAWRDADPDISALQHAKAMLGDTADIGPTAGVVDS
jgi:tetratricopeptide (TPR) repeat protein